LKLLSFYSLWPYLSTSPGVAGGDSFEAQPEAFESAVFFNGLIGILGASWVMAALA